MEEGDEENGLVEGGCQVLGLCLVCLWKVYYGESRPLQMDEAEDLFTKEPEVGGMKKAENDERSMWNLQIYHSRLGQRRNSFPRPSDRGRSGAETQTTKYGLFAEATYEQGG